MFCKIQLSDEESSVSLSQQGTVLNIQGKEGVYPCSLYVKHAFWLHRCLCWDVLAVLASLSTPGHPGGVVGNVC